MAVDPGFIKEMCQVIWIKSQRFFDGFDRLLQATIQQLSTGQHAQQVGSICRRPPISEPFFEELFCCCVAMCFQQNASRFRIELDVLLFTQLDCSSIELHCVVNPIQRLCQASQHIRFFEGQLRRIRLCLFTSCRKQRINCRDIFRNRLQLGLKHGQPFWPQFCHPSFKQIQKLFRLLHLPQDLREADITGGVSSLWQGCFVDLLCPLKLIRSGQSFRQKELQLKIMFILAGQRLQISDQLV